MVDPPEVLPSTVNTLTPSHPVTMPVCRSSPFWKKMMSPALGTYPARSRQRPRCLNQPTASPQEWYFGMTPAGIPALAAHQETKIAHQGAPFMP